MPNFPTIALSIAQLKPHLIQEFISTHQGTLVNLVLPGKNNNANKLVEDIQQNHEEVNRELWQMPSTW